MIGSKSRAEGSRKSGMILNKDRFSGEQKSSLKPCVTIMRKRNYSGDTIPQRSCEAKS